MLTDVQCLAVCGIMFFLTATNANPLWWSSAIPCSALSLFLILGREPRSLGAAAFAPGNRGITISILVFSAFIIVSAAVAPSLVTLEAALERALLPPIIYLSLVGLSLRPPQARWILTALIIGATLPLLRGTLAFYQEWGVPDLITLLWARYNTVRMSSYMMATFGNVGHMGAYLVLVTPMMVFLIVKYPIGALRRLFLTGLLALAFIHLTISGSRAALLVFFFSLAVILVRMGIRGGILLALSLLAIAMLAGYQSASYLGEQDILMRFMPSQIGTGIDESVVERYVSIHEGWAQFLDSPLFGIGPGMSPELNTYTVPHQSIVFVFSEIGILGGLAFLVLNLNVLLKLAVAAVASSPTSREYWTLLWVLGPACWLLYGLIAGFTFNLSLALVWIGTAYAMLALAGSRIVASDAQPGHRP